MKKLIIVGILVMVMAMATPAMAFEKGTIRLGGGTGLLGTGSGLSTQTLDTDLGAHDRILLRDEIHSWSVETQTQDLFLSKNFDGEFDPGSGRTLAVRLMHASRGRSSCSVRFDCGHRRTGA